MIREDLVAERIAIDSYKRWCGFRRNGTSLQQRSQVTGYRSPEKIEVVTSLQQSDDATLRVLFRNAQHVFRHFREIGILQQEISERISTMRIESR